MSVGINALLRQKPDRLIIEPTGLGHPKQVVATLISEQYQPYVDLKATIALMDPRHLSMDKYRSNQNFNDQLASADIVLGTKSISAAVVTLMPLMIGLRIKRLPKPLVSSSSKGNSYRVTGYAAFSWSCIHSY